MKKLILLFKNYWLAEETNIFKSYTDALCGLIILIVIPGLSVCFAIQTEHCTFWNYTFPFLSISLSGLYDTYGRYHGESARTPKLLIRMIFHFLSIFFSALCAGTDSQLLPLIPPLLLCVCGLLLLFEIYHRIKRAVLVSPWTIS